MQTIRDLIEEYLIVVDDDTDKESSSDENASADKQFKGTYRYKDVVINIYNVAFAEIVQCAGDYYDVSVRYTSGKAHNLNIDGNTKEDAERVISEIREEIAKLYK